MTTPQNKPREFWLRKSPAFAPEKWFITTKADYMDGAKGRVHVIEYSAYADVQERLAIQNSNFELERSAYLAERTRAEKAEVEIEEVRNAGRELTNKMLELAEKQKLRADKAIAALKVIESGIVSIDTADYAGFSKREVAKQILCELGELESV